jgi:hypothetical protein
MYFIGHIPHYHQRIYPHDQIQNRAASAGGDSSVSRMEKAELFQSQETDLTIVTKEGDHVTVSADSEFRLDFATYDSTGRMKGETSRLQAEALSLDSSQKFSISVEGDLNEQEKKDIQNILQSLDKTMNDLVSGRSDQGAAGAEKLGNLGSISSINATLQVEQSISVESAAMAGITSSPDKLTNSSEAT